jgi:hypothetical protein
MTDEQPPHGLDPAAITTKLELAAAIRTIKGTTSYDKIETASAELVKIQKDSAALAAAAGRKPKKWTMTLLGKSTVAGWMNRRGHLPDEDFLATFLRVFAYTDLQIQLWLEAVDKLRSPSPGTQEVIPSDTHPSGPITENDPTNLGVRQAINFGTSTTSDLPLLPPYVHRAHDERLRGTLRAAVANTMVVVVGGSATGKTRACFEAVAVELPDWTFLYPTNATELADVLDAGVAARTVVWLDEIKNYLDDDIVVAGVHRLLTDRRTASPVIIIGSMWPERWLRLTRQPDEDLRYVGAPARTLLRLRHVVKISIPDDFSSAAADEITELRRLAATDPRLAAAVEMGGENVMITQGLAGGPLLVDQYNTLLKPQPKAIISVAMDATRLGHQALSGESCWNKQPGAT